jgi:predicted SAM-dependent methyltransferase
MRTLSEQDQQRLQEMWQADAVAIAAEESAKQFAQLKGRRQLRVELGCGRTIRPGWVNIDTAAEYPKGFDRSRDLQTVVIRHDLSRGLPLPPDSCEVVYSSHMLEHFEYGVGVALLRDVHRSLQAGGRLRLVLPDYAAVFAAYIKRNHAYFDLMNLFKYPTDLERGTETLVDYVNRCVYERGQHRYIWDQEKLSVVLKHIGFREVAPSTYQEDLDVDNPGRRRYSFYMEAVK